MDEIDTPKECRHCKAKGRLYFLRGEDDSVYVCEVCLNEFYDVVSSGPARGQA